MKLSGAPNERIDTAEFSRRGEAIEGARAAHAFDRLREMLATDRGELRWVLSGERRARHEGGHDDYLSLSLDGEVELTCTRCLQPVRVEIGERRLYRLFANEAQALREDAEVDDHDALVGGAGFDPLALVEDEAMLALPIAPRHPDCAMAPDARSLGQTDETAVPERENPFAVLAKIRGGRGDA
jgi:uncharacterized protein